MKSVSVPIELLERITRPQLKPRDETVRRRAITELRALLDKEFDGDSHAPKKQGEPVAELQVAFFEHGPMATINWFTPSAFESGATKLYAEQPAPVAVVMPERMKVEPFTTIDRGSKSYKAGYNAAIAEVSKLNRIKT